MVSVETDEHLCRAFELVDAKPKVVRKGGRRLAIVKLADQVYVFNPVCPHWGGPLDQGEVSATRREITCPWHRLRFSLEDGRCVGSTAREPLELFNVVIRDDDVFATVAGPSR